MGKMILLVVLGTYFILGSFMRFNNDTSYDAVSNVTDYYIKANAKNIAASGANIAVSNIMRKSNWREKIIKDFSYGDLIVTAVDYPPAGANGVKIISVGKYHNYSDSVIVLMSMQGFNQYVWFTDEFSSGYFGDGHIFDGPFHSNENITIKGDAIFKGKVTLAEGPINIQSGDPEFWEGIEYVDKISMPSNLDNMKSAALSDGFYTDKELWLTFNGTDKVTYKTSLLGLPKTVALSTLAPNGLIHSDKEVHVEGIIDGSVTVSSKSDILIEDDVGVVDDPRKNKNSEQYLGLCTEKKVIIKETSILNLKKNIEIVAAIYAGDKLEAENYSSRPKGTLTIYGSRTQKRGGIIGSSSKGYVSQNIFDDRFWQNKYPPHFPLTNKMKIVSWWE